MHLMRFTHLRNGLLTHTHLQAETADNLNGVFFVRHQIAYLITWLIHATKGQLFIEIRCKITTKIPYMQEVKAKSQHFGIAFFSEKQ